MKQTLFILTILSVLSANGQVDTMRQPSRVWVFGKPTIFKDTVRIDSALIFRHNPCEGCTLTSDSFGNASWVDFMPYVWTTDGNSGTNPTVNYVGTTDSAQFYARSWFGNVNNQAFLFLSSPKRRTASTGSAFLALRDSLHNNGGVFKISSTGFDMISSNAAEDTDVTVHGSWKNKILSITSNQGVPSVGIGTTSPITNFDVRGGIAVITKTSDGVPIGFGVGPFNPFGSFSYGSTPSLVFGNLTSFGLPDSCFAIKTDSSYFYTQLYYQNGSQGAGKVLTSDANGRATWQGSVVYHVRDSISSTQILNSYTSPDTIIMGAGAGTTINVISVRYKYVYSTAPYTIPIICGLSQSGQLFETESTNLLALTTNANAKSAVATSQSTITFSNAPILYTSVSGDPTGGGGYLIVYIDYTIQQD